MDILLDIVLPCRSEKCDWQYSLAKWISYKTVMAWLLNLHDVGEITKSMGASLYQNAMFRQQIRIPSIISDRKGKVAGVSIRDTRRNTNIRVIPECIGDLLYIVGKVYTYTMNSVSLELLSMCMA